MSTASRTAADGDMRSSRVAVGSDSRDPVADSIAANLEDAGFAVIRCGAVEAAATPWPEVAEQVGRLVAQGAAEAGVVCCWTGTGVSIAANKVPGIRAALCKDAETARAARRWNGANVLALSLDGATPDSAQAIVDAFLGSGGVDPEEVANVERVAGMERRYGASGSAQRTRRA
ncbi:MAG: RpiB/LacA/LacB family sugar-phosphate isomerase [Candidatus Dormibacteria bacterium]